MEGLKAEPAVVQVDADPQVDHAVELPSEEALPEAPAVASNLHERVIQGEGDGGVEEHWDDDSGRDKEAQSFSDWGEVKNNNNSNNKAFGKNDADKGSLSHRGGGGLDGDACLLYTSPSPRD